MSAPPVMSDKPPKVAGRWQVLILLGLTVVVWFLLRGWGSDPDGLNYALNIETNDPTRFLGSDHPLWHILVWAGWTAGRLVMPDLRPVPVEQLVNLILFCVALYLFCRYLALKGKSWWWAGLGLLASFASLRAMSGEHVDSGSILATVILLFLLPGSPRLPRLWMQPLLLALLPWFHKTLFLFFPGYFLAWLCFSSENYPSRLIKPFLITLIATAVSLVGFGKIWLLFFSGQVPFSGWFLSYVGKETGFWASSLSSVFVGVPTSLYRMFLSLSPYKLWQIGNWLGLAGLALSGLALLMIALLVVRSIWRGKMESSALQENTAVWSMLIAIAPSLLFFCFWMPGMYYFWSRFLPVFWLVLALCLPLRGWVKRVAWALPVLLLAVNVPSLYQAKDGEEAGRLTRWLDGTVHRGDLVILGGEGVLFDGKMPQYHLGTDIVMLDHIGRVDDGEGFLHDRLQETISRNGHIWLVVDRGRFSSNRVISGESKAIQNGMLIVEKLCSIGEDKRFNDPGFEDAGISACQPR